MPSASQMSIISRDQKMGKRCVPRSEDSLGAFVAIQAVATVKFLLQQLDVLLLARNWRSFIL